MEPTDGCRYRHPGGDTGADMNLSASLRWFRKTLARLRRLNAEMDDEMQFHLDCLRRDLMKSELSEKEAEIRARREFGSRQFHKEDCRQALGLRLAGELTADLRYGARMMRRDRVLTATALVSLALGIGANSAVFSAIRNSGSVCVAGAQILRACVPGSPSQLASTRCFSAS